MLSAVVVAPWNEAAAAVAEGVQQGLELRLRSWRVSSAADASRSWLGWRGTVVIVLDRPDSTGDAAGIAALQAAVHKGLVIVPVLVDGAAMPDAATLPADLQHFPYLNAVLGNRQQFTALLDRVAEAVATPATHEEPWTPRQFVATVLAEAYPSSLRWSGLLWGGMFAVYAAGRWWQGSGRWSTIYAVVALAIAVPLAALAAGCRRLGWWGIPAALGFLFLLVVGMLFLALVFEGIIGTLLTASGVSKDAPARIAGMNAIFPAFVLGVLLAGRAIRQFRADPTMSRWRLVARTALLGSLVLGFLLPVDFAVRLAAASQGARFTDLSAPPDLLTDFVAILGTLQFSLLAGTWLGVADSVFKVWRGGPRSA
jgi:hypothetical protein